MDLPQSCVHAELNFFTVYLTSIFKISSLTKETENADSTQVLSVPHHDLYFI